MYAGRVVEHGPADKVFTDAAAPVRRRALGGVPAHRRPVGAVRAGRPARRPARPGRPAVRLLLPPALPASGSTTATAIDARAALRRWRAGRPPVSLGGAPMSDDRARGPRAEHHASAAAGGRSRGPSTASTSVAPARSSPWWGSPGSGKTTLARTLLGLEKPAAGEVLLDGAAARPLDPGAAGVPAPGAAGAPGPGRRAQPAAHGLRVRRRGHPAAPARAARGGPDRRPSWWPRRCRRPGCGRRSGSSCATRTSCPAVSGSAC